jgi:hypothetical protein
VSARLIDPAEYLSAPDDQSFAVEHCRGLALRGSDLYVALFNSVREYRVDDARALALKPGRVFTHRKAADIHGITVAGGTLYAASTATDSVVAWSLKSGRSRVIDLGNPEPRDLRFPMKLARAARHADWRGIVNAGLHLNQVCVHVSGAYATGLHRLVRIGDYGLETIVYDAQALFHDAEPDPDGLLALTDAARGQLVRIDPGTGRAIRLPVADANQHFVRGLCVRGDYAVVLRSERVVSRQRSPWRMSGAGPKGAAFGVSIIHLRSGAVELDRVVSMPDLAAGSVAYTAVAVPATDSVRTSCLLKSEPRPRPPEFTIPPVGGLD